MTRLVWLHEDALRADHPAMAAADENTLVCFIWDDQYLQKMDYGFKRLVFIYETLCELPVSIFRGDTVEVLLDIVASTDANGLTIPATPNPALQASMKQLSQHISIEIIEDTPFVNPTDAPDIKRFFRYWNKTRKLAMQKQGGRG